MKYATLLALALSTAQAHAVCMSDKDNLESMGDVKRILLCMQTEISKSAKGETISIRMVEGLPEPTISKTTDIGQFTVDLLACTRKSSNVECEFRVTNNGKDGKFYFVPKYSVAYDEFGNEIKGTVASWAGKGPSKYSVKKVLINKIPVKAMVRFGDFSSESTRIAALTIHHNTKATKCRDIAIK